MPHVAKGRPPGTEAELEKVAHATRRARRPLRVVGKFREAPGGFEPPMEVLQLPLSSWQR